ncbi:MAG TPA: pyruvate dehydrogenase (acetyl-transferring), homodimeric type, partial [Bryobacteraceae bacterium]|nr:pyruvate dehydrogenase (acetyl-transferring), homodimeric type [Bryobacteraceae bacterium]
QFPTVSMGLGPINSIYQARFLRYLENRGLLPVTDRKVWAFLGDGEMEEPESTGALRIPAHERLDNLIHVINCNLQRLDGPVRGNSNIIQELEGVYRGAGWNVIKVIWGSGWDRLFEKDKSGLLIRRMHECVDGEYQNYKAKGGAYVRQEFFGKYPELRELVSDMTDEQLASLPRGGHDPVKVYNAYKRAVEHKGSPTLILAKTVKGYGMGEAGEGRNYTHQQKKMNEQELEHLRERFHIPIPVETVHTVSFYRPADDSPEMKYVKARREAMGGPVPARKPKAPALTAPGLGEFADSLKGSGGRAVSTTMAFVGILKALLKNKELGKLVV